MLIHLVVDLARDPELRLRFEQDPESVLKDYPLSSEERKVLGSGSRRKIEKELQSSIPRLLDSALGPIVRPPWPGDPLGIESISPKKGVVNQKISFLVVGKYFPTSDQAEVRFTKGLQVVEGKDTVVDKAGTSSSSLTTSAKFEKAGTYDLTVQAKDSGESDTLAKAFEAKT